MTDSTLSSPNDSLDGSGMSANEDKRIAQELHEWFQSVFRMTERMVSGIAPDEPHRDAVLLDLLNRNARIVAESAIDTDGKLYSPLCFFLAAACKRLGT